AKSGRQRRQLLHVAAAVTPWPPEESTPPHLPAVLRTALQAGGRGYKFRRRPKRFQRNTAIAGIARRILAFMTSTS
ncbi:MAG: hypothetical protein Q8O57_00310, partial [Kiritimatiellota bacterium]|nr:hypothetical protein [Kiritimatiellota bacterium]